MEKSTLHFERPVYIVDGLRSPQLKARGLPGPFSASDLAVQTSRALLEKQPFNPNNLSEVVIGCIMPSPDEANIARIVAQRLGCGDAMPAYTVQRNCGTGLQAIDNAALDIASGRCDLVLAGGTEAMSHAPLLFNRRMVEWLARWTGAKGAANKAKVLMQFRLGYLAPVIALLRGLTDSTVGMSMGQTAEKVAYRFGITREQMDEFALQSHQRLVNAQDKGYLANEVTTIYDSKGKYYSEDDGARRDTILEKLALLKPFFDKPFGSVTAGNSSQVTDGATMLILASEDAVKKYQLPVLGKIIDIAWAGVDPTEMGLGPVYATTQLLKSQNLKKEDIDLPARF
jgi:acetyl-CoA C-acetyltransferase